VGTLSHAIVYYGLCSAVREQDFDLLKRIIDFLVEYNILSDERRARLREEISIRIPAKRVVETARLARRQRTAEEALAQRQAELADEAFSASPEVQAEVAAAERALEPVPTLPSQDLVVLPDPSGPPIEPLERGHSPSKVRISAEELDLIVAFRRALDAKERVNWQAYRGLREFDRLGLVTILDLAELVEGNSLPCAVVVPASQLTPIIYRHLGRPPLTQETLRSGIFYDRS
jgi:hypothetical protein